MPQKRIAIAGSHRAALANSTETGPIPAHETVSASVVFHRNEAHPGDDRKMLDEFAHQHQVSVSEWYPKRHYAVVTGTAAAMSQAFGTELACYKTAGGVSYRGRTGELTIPENLAGRIRAVLGLDTRPVAKPHFRERAHKAGAFEGYKPNDVARYYNFPTKETGAGETVGIIELGGGYSTVDLEAYFTEIDVPMPQIVSVSVDQAVNKPGGGADGEVMLDIEVVGAVAPGAKIVVYFAPNTDKGFHDAIATAIHDDVHKPSVISISWGGAESNWSQQARAAMAAAMEDAVALNVTITVAAGDDGATDDPSGHSQALAVDYPASDPNVLGCGGTRITVSGNAITDEVVWNELAIGNGATGGGVSAVAPRPAYQTNAKIAPLPKTKLEGRGVPDLSGNADPQSGYFVRVHGKNTVIGGTSAVAPLWAGLIALINQRKRSPVGFVNPALYKLPAADFRDITQTNNGYWKAGPGWDACTGLGSPNGEALARALSTPASASKPGPVSTKHMPPPAQEKLAS